MRYLRWLLFPVSLVYGLVTIIRNWCYDAGIFKSTGFDLPVISVGNLDVGGSGKTPMTEYLIRLLKDEYQLATLSRGYGRETKGFYQANVNPQASIVGDEPAQLKQKFPQVNVTVCEDRVAGVQQIKDNNDVIILDDAYQHRAVKSGFSILLFDYRALMGINMLLPAGNRRELFHGRWRADVIVVTKCPPDLDNAAMERACFKVNPHPHQQVYFTGIDYMPLQRGGQAAALPGSNTTVFLLTGIANPVPMHQYLTQSGAHIIHHKYPDHHRFSLKNIAKLAADFEACNADKKLIITTEKDMQRLQEQDLLHLTQTLPVYTLPIGTVFLNNAGDEFNQLIKNYVRQHTAHRGIH